MMSRVNPSVLGVLVAGACLVATAGAAQARFDNPTAGISIAPPAGWHVMSMQRVMENRAQVRLGDDELAAGFQRATAPLFVFSKYTEPHAAVNPTVQIVLRPAPASLGASATAMLKAATETLQRAFPDFTFVEPIQPAKVAGFPAAYMKATYTLRTESGGAFRVMSRTWLVPRGKVMFLVGMSGTTSGEDVSEAEFRAALESIRIEK
jgi:hypothetical protein